MDFNTNGVRNPNIAYIERLKNGTFIPIINNTKYYLNKCCFDHFLHANRSFNDIDNIFICVHCDMTDCCMFNI